MLRRTPPAKNSRERAKYPVVNSWHPSPEERYGNHRRDRRVPSGERRLGGLAVVLASERVAPAGDLPQGCLTGFVHHTGQRVRILCPLWTEAHRGYQGAKAAAEQAHAGATVTRMNLFRLLRRPAEYV